MKSVRIAQEQRGKADASHLYKEDENRIKDQKALFRIVAADEDAYVRISATVGLKDQVLLAQTAVQNSDSDI